MTRWAIIGASERAGVYARVLAGLPGAELTWAADIEFDRARARAADPRVRTTANHEQAIAAPDVDAVVVAGPASSNRTIVELAAAYGKHVLCEPPIALTSEDAGAMIAACDGAGVRLMIGHAGRFSPEYVLAKRVLDEGTLGKIGVARASRVDQNPGGSRTRIADPVAEDGVVLSLMIHEIDTLQWFFGDIARVFALGPDPAANQTGAEYVQALLRFDSGVVAHVEASWAHAGFRARLELAGEFGILAHDSEESATLRFDLPGDDGSPARVERRSAPSLQPYADQLSHFLARLHDGGPFLTGGDQGLRALDAALAVRASARSGKPIHFRGGRPQYDGSAA